MSCPAGLRSSVRLFYQRRAMPLGRQVRPGGQSWDHVRLRPRASVALSARSSCHPRHHSPTDWLIEAAAGRAKVGSPARWRRPVVQPDSQIPCTVRRRREACGRARSARGSRERLPRTVPRWFRQRHMVRRPALQDLRTGRGWVADDQVQDRVGHVEVRLRMTRFRRAGRAGEILLDRISFGRSMT
jgi:hypothetical protein